MRTEPETTPAERDAIDPVSWIDDHGDALFRIALAETARADLAEDLVQETFVAALAALSRFQGRSSARTWLVAILRHKILDWRRKAKAAAKVAHGASESNPSPTFDDRGVWLNTPSRWEPPRLAIERDELRAALDGCVGHLPPLLAQVFLMRERDEADPDDIRRALGISAANLRVRLYRARLLLRECLEKNGFGGRDGR